ncbi:hypothetical protein Dimus_010376 [Dionaea muscipula]
MILWLSATKAASVFCKVGSAVEGLASPYLACRCPGYASLPSIRDYATGPGPGPGQGKTETWYYCVQLKVLFNLVTRACTLVPSNRGKLSFGRWFVSPTAAGLDHWSDSVACDHYPIKPGPHCQLTVLSDYFL